MVLGKSPYPRFVHKYMQDYSVQFQIDLTESVKGSVSDYIRLQ